MNKKDKSKGSAMQRHNKSIRSETFPVGEAAFTMSSGGKKSKKNFQSIGSVPEDASSSESDSSPEERTSKSTFISREKSKKRSIVDESDEKKDVTDEDEEEEEDNDESVEEESEVEEDGSDDEEEDSGEDDETEEEGKRVKRELPQTNVDSTKHTEEPQHPDEFVKLRKELASMPFDELQRLKEKIGIKLYNQVMFGKGEAVGPKRFKRENKNRPMEVSSKTRPRKLRQVVDVKKRMVRDPRFDDLSGTYREDIFKKTYSFLDDIKQKEKQKVKQVLKKERNEEKRQELDHLYKRLTAQERAEKQKETLKERDRERRRQERALLAEGKKPFFLKNSDKKKLELADKYRELKRKGKLDQYLSRKRKKNASKEKRNLPSLSS